MKMVAFMSLRIAIGLTVLAAISAPFAAASYVWGERGASYVATTALVLLIALLVGMAVKPE